MITTLATALVLPRRSWTPCKITLVALKRTVSDEHFFRGSAAIDKKKELIAIAHSGGFTLHDPNTREGTVAVYKAEKSRMDLPKPIIFGKGRRVVIIGSDHGKAYIFNKRRGDPPVDTLVHSDDPTELVQSVAVCCF